jgi:hypothetical protein
MVSFRFLSTKLRIAAGELDLLAVLLHTWLSFGAVFGVCLEPPTLPKGDAEVPCGRKRKLRKIATHKRKKKLRKNRHKNK